MPFNNPPWIPLSDPRTQKTIGKTGEEVNELGKVLFRISIQGIDEINPATGKTNRQELIEEMSDVEAQIHMIGEELKIYPDVMRIERKIINQRRWLNDMNVEGNSSV